jgi:hypothetical protein
MPALIKLPNGDHVDAFQVGVLKIVERGFITGPHLVLIDAGQGALAVRWSFECPSLAEARALRDRLAAEVNIARTGDREKQLLRVLSKVRAFLADEVHHLLSSFAVHKVGKVDRSFAAYTPEGELDPDTMEPDERAYYDRAKELFAEVTAAMGDYDV